jgi:hypothetical protein
MSEKTTKSHISILSRVKTCSMRRTAMLFREETERV